MFTICTMLHRSRSNNLHLCRFMSFQISSWLMTLRFCLFFFSVLYFLVASDANFLRCVYPVSCGVLRIFLQHSLLIMRQLPAVLRVDIVIWLVRVLCIHAFGNRWNSALSIAQYQVWSVREEDRFERANNIVNKKMNITLRQKLYIACIERITNR